MTGDLNMTGGGVFRNDTNPVTLDDTGQAMPATINIGTTTAIPPYTINRVGNSDTTNTLTLSLFNGSIGQEIFFVYTTGSGLVTINGVSGNLVLRNNTTGVAVTNLNLNQIGESVHLLCIDNGSGVGVWYVVGGVGYTTT